MSKGTRTPGGPRRVLVLGGAKSGKSEFAASLAASFGKPVLFVATATAGDPEMVARIGAHRTARPASWKTIEAQTGVSDAIRGHLSGAPTVLLDCLSLLVSNCLLATPGGSFSTNERVASDELDDSPPERVAAEVSALLKATGAAGSHLVVVSSEVGLGIVPEYPLGRTYRDALGTANQQMAMAADDVYLLVAGVPVELKRIAASVEVPGPVVPPDRGPS